MYGVSSMDNEHTHIECVESRSISFENHSIMPYFNLILSTSPLSVRLSPSHCLLLPICLIISYTTDQQNGHISHQVNADVVLIYIFSSQNFGHVKFPNK